MSAGLDRRDALGEAAANEPGGRARAIVTAENCSPYHSLPSHGPLCVEEALDRSGDVNRTRVARKAAGLCKEAARSKAVALLPVTVDNQHAPIGEAIDRKREASAVTYVGASTSLGYRHGRSKGECKKGKDKRERAAGGDDKPTWRAASRPVQRL